MNFASARQRGAQLDSGNDLHPEAVTGGARLADTGHRVVIGERQGTHVTRSGLLDCSTRLPWLHNQPDGGAVLVLDDDIDEGRQTDGFDSSLPQVDARDGD